MCSLLTLLQLGCVRRRHAAGADARVRCAGAAGQEPVRAGGLGRAAGGGRVVLGRAGGREHGRLCRRAAAGRPAAAAGHPVPDGVLFRCPAITPGSPSAAACTASCVQSWWHGVAIAELAMQPPPASSTPPGVAVSTSMMDHLHTVPVTWHAGGKQSGGGALRGDGPDGGGAGAAAAAAGAVLPPRPPAALPRHPRQPALLGRRLGCISHPNKSSLGLDRPPSTSRPATCVHVVYNGNAGPIAQGCTGLRGSVCLLKSLRLDVNQLSRCAGIRHSVGGADYGTVRAAAFMGLALMSAREAAAHPRPPSLDGRLPGPADIPLIGGNRAAAASSFQNSNAHCVIRCRLQFKAEYCVCWQPLKLLISTAGGGYVCAVAPSLFEQAHSDALPAALSGADFLAAHGRHLDAATTVQPDTR